MKSFKHKDNLFGHAGVYTISNIAVAGVPFLLLPLLTRALDPAAFGMVAMFSLVVAFMSVGVGLNIHGAITVRYFDNSNYDIPRYVSSAFFVLVLSSILIFFLVLLIGEGISKVTSIPLGWLYVSILVAFFQIFVQILLALWQAAKQSINYGVFKISLAVLDAFGSIILVVVLSFSWQGRISGMLAAWLCAAIIAAFFLIRGRWLVNSIDLSYTRDALSYGIPLVPHALGGLLLGMADRFMVTSILDVTNTGVYVVAVQIGLIIGILADSFNRAFAPWLMEKLGNIDYKLQRKIVLFTYAYFLSILLFAVLGGALTPYLLPIIVGPQYQSAGSIIIYILIGNAFTGMYYMVTNYIFFSRRTGLLSTLTMIVGALTVVSSWFLIKAYGLTGAAIGFMLGQAGLFFGAWVLSNICVPMPWFRALTSRMMLR